MKDWNTSLFVCKNYVHDLTAKENFDFTWIYGSGRKNHKSCEANWNYRSFCLLYKYYAVSYQCLKQKLIYGHFVLVHWSVVMVTKQKIFFCFFLNVQTQLHIIFFLKIGLITVLTDQSHTGDPCYMWQSSFLFVYTDAKCRLLERLIIFEQVFAFCKKFIHNRRISVCLWCEKQTELT